MSPSPSCPDRMLAIDESYRQFCRDRCLITSEAYMDGKMQVLDLSQDFPLLDTYVARLVGAGRFMVIHTNPLENTDDEHVIIGYIKGIVELARDYEISWKVTGSEETKSLEYLLCQSGFAKEEESAIMYLDFSEYIFVAQSGLVVKQIKDRAGLDDFAGIHRQRNESVGSYFLGFDMESRPVKEDQVRFYIGYDDGVPVTCTQIIFSRAGNVGIQSLATHPSHQNKGHASLLLSHIIAELALAKCKFVFLGATCKSVDIYKRLGFTKHGHFTSFVRK